MLTVFFMNSALYFKPQMLHIKGKVQNHELLDIHVNVKNHEKFIVYW